MERALFLCAVILNAGIGLASAQTTYYSAHSGISTNGLDTTVASFPTVAPTNGPVPTAALTNGPVPTAAPTNGPGASVSCDSTSMTVFLDVGLLENSGAASDVHLEDMSCIGYDYDAAHIAVTTRYDDCDTQSESTADVIKFSNVVTYFKPTSENGSVITRDFRLKIPVTCELNRRSMLGSSFKPKLGVVSFSETGYGNFSLSLGRFADGSLNAAPADPNAEVFLGEDIYFGVNLTAVTDLTLLIDRCWATPDVYPMDPTQYTFIDNGCGKDPTVAFYDVAALLKGFSIDAFAFIGEYPEVYIHCDVLVCDNSDPSSRCAQGCVTRAKRSAMGARGSSSKPHTVSNGPLSNQHAEVSGASANDSGWSMSPVNMMLVGAAGFFITMVAMVTVKKLRSRDKPSGKGYRRLDTETDQADVAEA